MIALTRFEVETDTGATVSDGHRSGSNTPRIWIQSPTHISCLNFEARLGRDVTVWTPDEVKNWLKVAGFLDVSDDLYSHRVDGFGLTTLSRRVLTMMDIPAHRIFLLMDAISQLRHRTRNLASRRPPSPARTRLHPPTTPFDIPQEDIKAPETIRARSATTPEPESKADQILERMFSDSELIVLSRELANRVTLGRFTVTNDYFADEENMTGEDHAYADDEDSESYDSTFFHPPEYPNSHDSGYYEERDDDSLDTPTASPTPKHTKKKIRGRKSRHSMNMSPSEPTTPATPVSPFATSPRGDIPS